MPQQVIEIPLADLTKKLQAQLKLGRKILNVLPRYTKAEGGGLILEGYLCVVKVPKKDKVKLPGVVVH